MSYLVLARKWRPKTFADTVGQVHVLKALTNALASERLHHAYLFAGTRGVGKTTIARIFAKALNCETGVSAEPCGKCSACQEIDEGRFVDLIEVDAASKTKVDDTRELLDNVQYSPARGRFKVYLIDEVHMLSRNSFNALLKTLEEPPPHVKFLLATTDPQKLPVTVLSRCLQFNLKRLTPSLIRERLTHICEVESIEADTAALELMARAADGSLRDALSLLDQAIAYCGGALREDAVMTMLGTVNRQHVYTLIELLIAADAPGLMAAVASLDEQFPDYANLLDDTARVLQRIAVLQAVGSLDAEDDLDEERLSGLAAEMNAEDLQLFYQIAINGRRDLHLSPDPRSGCEMTLLRMLAFCPDSGSESPGRKNPGANAANQHKPKGQTVSQTAPRPPATPPLTAGAKKSWQEPDWPDVVAGLGLSGLNLQLAKNCAYVRRRGATLHLKLDRRSESFLTRARQVALETALSEQFGEKLRVEIDTAEEKIDSPVQAEEQQKEQQLQAARDDLESDPNVRALKDMFGAELVTESVKPLQNGSMPEQKTAQE